MSAAAKGAAGVEIVPLGDRVAAMVGFRVLYLVVLHGMLLALHLPQLRTVLVASAVYLALTTLLSLAVRVASTPVAARCFGVALLVDGLFVTYLRETLGHRAGVDIGPLALLVAVVLLASFRTGIKVALWLSVLFLVALRSQETGLLPPPAVLPGGLDGEQRLAVDLLSLWLVTITTAAAAAAAERELRRRRFDAEALARFAERLHLATRVEEVAGHLAGFAGVSIGATRAVVLRTVGGSVQLVADVASDRRGQGSGADRRRLPVVVADAGTSALLDLPRSADNLALALRLDPERDPWLSALLPDARRIAVADITDAPGERIVLVVALRGRGDRTENRALETFAQATATASLAWSRADLLVAAERRASTDGLTGLANRRTFDDMLARLHEGWTTSGTPYALVLTDVDKFKSVNDRYGHQAGDEVLQIVARVLMEHAGAFGATAARYGGEEFGVLLPGGTTDEAMALAEKVRLALHGVTEPVPVTSSFGVAAVPEHCTEPAALVHASDAALIHAKNTGRDRVVAAGDYAMPAGGSAAPPSGAVPPPRRRDLRAPAPGS
ncbi:diguanylate cyclase [Kineosporia sp. A_224]|uniref:GGDEF domain-containing protein n=1 Tax=Kineosporia sp. A_224 TaxID=1962180 RepID=UPI000B4BF51F|nr:GGDEF domain-containing protein [Kineosporia sp. A_224]